MQNDHVRKAIEIRFPLQVILTAYRRLCTRDKLEMLQYVVNEYNPEILFMVEGRSGFSSKLTSVFNKLANITDNDKVLMLCFPWNSNELMTLGGSGTSTGTENKWVV